MYWDAPLETIKPADLQELQLQRLKETLSRAARSPFYAERLAQAGVNPDKLKRLEDVRWIPFTTKDDLRARGREMLTVPLSEIVRLHASSGTTGRATVIFTPTRDIAAWTNLLARSMYMTGMRRSDVFQNMMGYGLFTGGLGFHYGAEQIGALVIPAGAGNSARQIQLMRISIPRSSISSPATPFTSRPSLPNRRRSPPRHAAEDRLPRGRAAFGEDAPEDRGVLRLQGLQLLRPLRDERPGGGLRVSGAERHARLGRCLPAGGGASRDPGAGGPGRGGGVGVHQPHPRGPCRCCVPHRDLASFDDAPCPCGRGFQHLRIQGRSDDMLIVKGVNIFPLQIDKVLMSMPEVGSHYLVEVSREDFNEPDARQGGGPGQFFSRGCLSIRLACRSASPRL